MDSRAGSIGRLNRFIGAVARPMMKWRRAAFARLSLRYPILLRFLPTPRPLTVCRRPFHGPIDQRDLFVLLPGIGDSAEEFEDRGFVDLVRTRNWAVDLVLVDAHYGYYADRTVLDQLRQDVFLPARTMGYRHIWLGGISLGGFGALLYASRYGEDLAGVVALAPFLGTQTIVQEIAMAGGLARWTADITTADEVATLWRWLQARRGSALPSPQVFLAFGEQDVFVEAHRLLATSLPRTHVITAPGGHRWPVWQRLWEEFLRRHVPADRAGA